MLSCARAAWLEAAERWANPSSPHAPGRAARAMVEDARARIGKALGWDGEIIFTSGASEAIGIGLTRHKMSSVAVSLVEHDAVLRQAPSAYRLRVDGNGIVGESVPGALHAIQLVNNETGVIQPVEAYCAQIHGTGGMLLCDASQGAGKIDLPTGADMIAIGAHKFGGPPGVGALLVRDYDLLTPNGGQERGYRAGTEDVPGIMAMAAALEFGRGWMSVAATLRADIDREIERAGGHIVARDAPRIPTIASYRMPGVSARAQLIRFDMAGISVSAGAACSSGALSTSPVLHAMGWEEAEAGEVIRVSIGPDTDADGIARFLTVWRALAGGA